MRQHVHGPHLLPRGVRLRECVVEIELLRGEACIRNQDVDASVLLLGRDDHGCHGFRAAHIAGERQSTELVRGVQRRGVIEIDDDDTRGTATGELPAERPADPARPARDERHAADKLHAP